MLEGTFWFNGRCSDEFGLKIGYVGHDGKYNFGIARETNIETIPHYYSTYELGSSYSPLKKTFAIYSEQPLTTKKRMEICDWLFIDEFCELYSQCQPDIVYYCKINGDVEKWIGCGLQGYMECEMICNSPFAWTRPRVLTRHFDINKYKENGNEAYTSHIDVRNDSNYNSWGDFIVKLHIPEKSFFVGQNISINNTELSIKITNTTNSKDSDAFIISSENCPNMPLYFGETIQIDMNEGYVYTDISKGVGDVYKHRISNTNNKFIKLNKGLNKIEITGVCDYQIITQFPILH